MRGESEAKPIPIFAATSISNSHTPHTRLYAGYPSGETARQSCLRTSHATYTRNKMGQTPPERPLPPAQTAR